MPSACLAAVANVAQTMFTAPLNKVCRLTGLQISNGTGGGACTITIRDTFTTTTSNGAASAAVTQTKKIVYSPATAQYSWEDEAKSIKILGLCEVISDVVTVVGVTAMWEYD